MANNGAITIKDSYVDTKNESQVIAQGSNNVGGLIGQSLNPVIIEKSGIYQGIISSGSRAGKYFYLKNFYLCFQKKYF